MAMVSLSGPEADPEGGAFWRFSVDFYGQPGVAAACLELQDRHGLDVNLALFACWVGISGRGQLTPAVLGAAESAIESWRRSVVEPLRTLRRRMASEADAADLYRTLKSAELAAERVTQNRLESQAPAPADISAGGRLADALANLALYLGPGAASAAADPLRIALHAG